MSRNIRGRLDRLERGQPNPSSANIFDRLLGVMVGTVDPADLSPDDRAWVERICGGSATEEARNREHGPAEAR